MESQDAMLFNLAKMLSDDLELKRVMDSISSVNMSLAYEYQDTCFLSDALEGVCPLHFNKVLFYISFRFNQNGFASYFASIKDFKRNRRTEKKVGKFLKECFPKLEDSKVESVVSSVKKAYSPPDYELIQGSSESNFLEAYTGKIISRPTPSWNHDEKSLSGSCMQGKFSPNEHPCKVYASGDFSIVYLKQKETGLIGARVIVGNDTAGPIYSACDVATMQILAYLKEKEIGLESNWEGLSLSAIRVGGTDDEYLMPYVDNYSNFHKEDDSIIIGYSSDGFEFASTCGRVRIRKSGTFYCDHCGEYEESTNEIVSGFACDCCLSNYYTYSSLMGLYTWDETLGETYDGRFASQSWFEDNDYVLNEDGFYCPVSECVYVEEFGEYYHKSNDSIFERNGVLYHEDSKEGKAILAREKEAEKAYEVKEQWAFGFHDKLDYNMANRLVNHPTMGIYLVSSETVLRDNFQLDETGFPVRLPELPFLELTPEIAGVDA